MAGNLADKGKFKLRQLSDTPTNEIAESAFEAGKKARDKALNSGLEVTYIDDQGRKAIDKKLPDGTIKTIIQEQSKSND